MHGKCSSKCLQNVDALIVFLSSSVCAWLNSANTDVCIFFSQSFSDSLGGSIRVKWLWRWNRAPWLSLLLLFRLIQLVTKHWNDYKEEKVYMLNRFVLSFKVIIYLNQLLVLSVGWLPSQPMRSMGIVHGDSVIFAKCGPPLRKWDMHFLGHHNMMKQLSSTCCLAISCKGYSCCSCFTLRKWASLLLCTSINMSM